VGLARRAQLVVTADHGMGFDVGVLDRRTISEGNIDEIAPVPLFVKAPGQLRGRVDRTYVHTVDVVPTIAGLLSLRRLWPMEGRSAFERRGAHQVRVPRFDLSGSVTIAPGPLELARAANRREKARLFGTGAQSLYRIGPNRSLLGRLVADLDVEPGAVKTRGFTSRFQFRPSTNFAPTWFTGQLVIGRAPEGKRDLALALNGRVVAVGRSFRLRGERTDRFSLLVPESGLAPSVNRAALFAVRGGRLLRLEPAG
jgi:hypothetical protein